MKFTNVLILASALIAAEASNATPITVNPIADGSLYTCGLCTTVSDGAYVLTARFIQGAIKFPTTEIRGNVVEAVLTVNPYGLPLWSSSVDIYGYETPIGNLDITDLNAGNFLGTLILPANLTFGQDAYFDVKSFVASARSPYIAFNLRTADTDVFSSLEYNYGHPSQLLINVVPEPSTIVLIAASLLGLCMRRVQNGRISKRAAL